MPHDDSSAMVWTSNWKRIHAGSALELEFDLNSVLAGSEILLFRLGLDARVELRLWLNCSPIRTRHANQLRINSELLSRLGQTPPRTLRSRKQIRRFAI